LLKKLKRLGDIDEPKPKRYRLLWSLLPLCTLPLP
jgi:hypothetical protein